jgi:hypothetical protein
MKSILLIIVIFTIGLVAVLTVKTFNFKSRQITEANVTPFIQPVDEQAVKHLSEAIRIPTISYDDTLKGNGGASIDSFSRFLKNTYPLVFGSLEDTIFPSGAILLKWPGTANEQKGSLISIFEAVNRLL